MRGKIKTFYRSSKTKVHYVILVVIPKQHGVALYLVDAQLIISRDMEQVTGAGSTYTN